LIDLFIYVFDYIFIGLFGDLFIYLFLPLIPQKFALSSPPWKQVRSTWNFNIKYTISIRAVAYLFRQSDLHVVCWGEVIKRLSQPLPLRRIAASYFMR